MPALRPCFGPVYLLVVLIGASSAATPSLAGQAPQPSAGVAGSPAPDVFGRPPDELEPELAANRAAEADWLHALSLRLVGAEEEDVEELQTVAAQVLRLRGVRLSRNDPSWPEAQADRFIGLMLVDARRFLYDTDFRAVVVPIVGNALDSSIGDPVRRRLMAKINTIPGVDFSISEKIEVAWGMVPRSSRAREADFAPTRPSSAQLGPISASIYSLPSAFFTFAEAARFLRGVQAFAPQRTLVVLSNAPLIDELSTLRSEMRLQLIDSHGREYTPWPRDPFMIMRPPGKPVTAMVRPNQQARREEDVFMARELVQGLPPDLDADWGGMQWSIAPVPFHGGHMVMTPGNTWVSLHTLAPRLHELMGSERLTWESFRRPDVLEALIPAINQAAQELRTVFDQPVRFVHAWPGSYSEQALNALQVIVRGGEGRDLDSLVTLLPDASGGITALVGDLTLAGRLVADAPPGDFLELQATYDLQAEGEQLRNALLDAQSSASARLLDGYLDAIAAYLGGAGLQVRRLPLFDVPNELVRADLRYYRDGFLLTWNNVVLEAGGGGNAAEGFASGMPSIDDAVRKMYADAGYTLHYAPPLAMSIMREGGYRCASNHVR